MAGIGTDAIPALMLRNLLEVFGGRDPVARRAAIEELYDPEVRFVDPEGEGVGHDAIDAAAQAILDRFPDFHFTPAAPPAAAGDLGRLPWEMRTPDDTVTVRGMDVALFADGRITRFWVFVEAP
ncbi:MAG TPA: nuclear transport factor 2 family protein [Solirubrobacterales bacterium]|nr:nuclear transport factor 2 family protein [Solirubrobacterales bacterium]